MLVTDSATLAEAVLAYKLIHVSDLVGLADQPLKDWTVFLTDSLSLSDQPLTDKLLLIAANRKKSSQSDAREARNLHEVVLLL